VGKRGGYSGFRTGDKEPKLKKKSNGQNSVCAGKESGVIVETKRYGALSAKRSQVRKKRKTTDTVHKKTTDNAGETGWSGEIRGPRWRVQKIKKIPSQVKEKKENQTTKRGEIDKE